MNEQGDLYLVCCSRLALVYYWTSKTIPYMNTINKVHISFVIFAITLHKDCKKLKEHRTSKEYGPEG